MAIRRRQSARYLVPEPVLEYVDRHNLYSSLPTAVTYDDLTSPAATGETSTSGDAMQESSYSIPSHYSYPSTSRIIDTSVDRSIDRLIGVVVVIVMQLVCLN